MAFLIIFCLLLNCATLQGCSNRANNSKQNVMPKPVGEWHFDKLLNGITPDTYQLHNACTNNAAVTAGKFRNAILFNGYNSYVTIPVNGMINTGNDFTISILVLFNSLDTDRNIIIAQQQGENGVTLLQRRADGRIESDLGGVKTIGSTFIQLNKCYQVTVARKDAVVKLYVDGSLDALSDDTDMISCDGDIRIGADSQPDRSNAWEGYIDEVKIFNQALDNEQIPLIYNLYWPDITLKGPADITLNLNSKYVEYGAVANDHFDGDLSPKVIKKGSVDTAHGGTYLVKYTVTDSKGAESTKVRAVTVLPPEILSRASSELIKKGLQLQTWMTTDTTGRKFASKDEWNDSNLTTATYYEGSSYNKTFQQENPGAEWGMVKGAFGQSVTNPTEEEKTNGYLSKDQLANIKNLTTVCFGDEENFNTSIVDTFKQWFELSHKLYPNVLVHSNQQAKQWQSADYQYYMQTAKPDVLTFDDYLYTPDGTDRNMFTTIVNYINAVRTFALAGYDGTGRSPIAFGQYLLGFKTGDNNNYVITESQINAVPFATLTMGGKWLSLFRWEYQSDVFLLFDKSGKRTQQYYQYAQMAKKVRYLSPYLVRLNSTDVYFLAGENMDENGKVVNDSTPDNIQGVVACSNEHPYIRNITAVNEGKQNSGLRGDVLVGFYKPLPDTGDFFPSPNMEYFMVMNGLTAGNGLPQSSQHGSGKETQQTITLQLNLAKYKADALKMIDQDTGKTKRVPLQHISGYNYKVVITLNGGSAELFQLDKTPKKNYVPVSKISLPRTKNIKSGDTTALTASVAPQNATEKSLIWNSSDEDVAKVDAQGHITALAAGTATITAKSLDSGIKVRCKLNVNGIISVTEVSVNPSSVKINAGEKMSIAGIVYPLNATDKTINWSSSNEKVVRIDKNGHVSAVGGGSATILAVTADGYKSVCNVFVRDKHNDARISQLLITKGGKDISNEISFDSQVNNYTLRINSAVQKLEFKPKLSNGQSSLKVNDQPVKSGQIVTATFPEGISQVQFFCTAVDGKTIEKYTINVIKGDNLALKAIPLATATGTYTTNDYSKDYANSPAKFIDGNYNTYFRSNIVKQINSKGELNPEKITLLWAQPINLNKIVLAVNNAQRQGLKLFNINITEDSGWDSWSELPDGKFINWQTDSNNICEKEPVNVYEKDRDGKITKEVTGVTGISLDIWCSNLYQGRYALSELEVYNDVNANAPITINISNSLKVKTNTAYILIVVAVILLLFTVLAGIFFILKLKNNRPKNIIEK